MRIVYFGTPEFAVAPLRHLLAAGHSVVGVVCQADKPAGRGQHVAAPPVKLAAIELRLPLLQPAKARDPEFFEALRAWQPELIAVAAYGKILPKTILDLPRWGCINVHASLLPRHRGAAPIQWAIFEGDPTTGVTIMQMSEKMDAGDILLQRVTPISDTESYGELQSRLADIGAAALVEALAQLPDGRLVPQVQDEALVTYAPMIEKEQGRIDWQRPAAAIGRQVRAFNPWPSAFTTLEGKLLKIHRAHPAAAVGRAGEVSDDGVSVHVGTGSGVLVLEEVQVEGRKRMSARDCARGGALRSGVKLGG